MTVPSTENRPHVPEGALIAEGTYPDPRSAYQTLLADGTIRPDVGQEAAVVALQSLHQVVTAPDFGTPFEPQNGAGGWLSRIGLFARTGAVPQAPDTQTAGAGATMGGLYLHGGVGRGKSMLMDLFHQTVPGTAKRRVHFHAFMLEVHDRLHRWRQASLQGKAKEADPLPRISDDIAKASPLLCFDEFHVTDIADAMILSRLFTALLERGVVVVATSNWPPDRLYEGGLQRDRFLPFIDLIKSRWTVMPLDGGTDYRQERLRGKPAYFYPLTKATHEALVRIAETLTGGRALSPDVVMVGGRRLSVPRQAPALAWFTFEELCGRPLGAADYLALADNYPALIVEGVPVLTAERRNEAKRFILLIDALYERRRRLFLAAEAPVDRLYTQGHHAFEFERTLSRLMEMQSADYKPFSGVGVVQDRDGEHSGSGKTRGAEEITS